MERVTSGVVEGSVFGLNLFKVEADLIFRRIKIPYVGYADDFKFLCDVTINRQATGQAEIDIVCDWSDEFCNPLKFEKSVVLICGSHQKQYIFTVHDKIMNSVESLKDLGVKRSSDGNCTERCFIVDKKAVHMAGEIRH